MTCPCLPGQCTILSPRFFILSTTAARGIAPPAAPLPHPAVSETSELAGANVQASYCRIACRDLFVLLSTDEAQPAQAKLEQSERTEEQVTKSRVQVGPGERTQLRSVLLHRSVVAAPVLGGLVEKVRDRFRVSSELAAEMTVSRLSTGHNRPWSLHPVRCIWPLLLVRQGGF